MIPTLIDKYRHTNIEVQQKIEDALREAGIEFTNAHLSMIRANSDTATYNFTVHSPLSFAQVAALIDDAFCDDAQLQILIKFDDSYLATLKVDVAAALISEDM